MNLLHKMKSLGLIEWMIIVSIVGIITAIAIPVCLSIFGDPCETVHRCQKQSLTAIINGTPHYKCEQYIVEPRNIKACMESQ